MRADQHHGGYCWSCIATHRDVKAEADRNVAYDELDKYEGPDDARTRRDEERIIRERTRAVKAISIQYHRTRGGRGVVDAEGKPERTG